MLQPSSTVRTTLKIDPPAPYVTFTAKPLYPCRQLGDEAETAAAARAPLQPSSPHHMDQDKLLATLEVGSCPCMAIL